MPILFASRPILLGNQREPDLRIPKKRTAMPEVGRSVQSGDRRGLIQMAEDWHALADKVRQREANPQEQEPEPVAARPKSPEPSEPPLRPKRPQRKARMPVQTVILKSR